MDEDWSVALVSAGIILSMLFKQISRVRTSFKWIVKLTRHFERRITNREISATERLIPFKIRQSVTNVTVLHSDRSWRPFIWPEAVTNQSSRAAKRVIYFREIYAGFDCWDVF